MPTSSGFFKTTEYRAVDIYAYKRRFVMTVKYHFPELAFQKICQSKQKGRSQ